MKKVYITPTVFFDEVLDCDELLILSKEKVNDLTGNTDLTMGDGSTIQGDGGNKTDNGFVNSKGGFFDDDVISDWDF